MTSLPAPSPPRFTSLQKGKCRLIAAPSVEGDIVRGAMAGPSTIARGMVAHIPSPLSIDRTFSGLDQPRAGPALNAKASTSATYRGMTAHLHYERSLTKSVRADFIQPYPGQRQWGVPLGLESPIAESQVSRRRVETLALEQSMQSNAGRKRTLSLSSQATDHPSIRRHTTPLETPVQQQQPNGQPDLSVVYLGSMRPPVPPPVSRLTTSNTHPLTVHSQMQPPPSSSAWATPVMQVAPGQQAQGSSRVASMSSHRDDYNVARRHLPAATPGPAPGMRTLQHTRQAERDFDPIAATLFVQDQGPTVVRP
ncbi:hypothetical protein IW261DRAFT_1422987 [Armillaria novae-zelandiae]|uniref:Uncharacterized protein n=1 Tax=Armillaria novae-zelandiae TaxID=153914 RepID=A0AA39NZI3_9AGAR|nr:hypothetical protein IW261DRAFT_1422987 [Armillaria novae-zelandiae]